MKENIRILHNSHKRMIGRPWGNAMIKLLVFNGICKMIPEYRFQFSNLDFPMWSIKYPDLLEGSKSDAAKFFDATCYDKCKFQGLDIEYIKKQFSDGNICALFPAYYQRFEYFPSVEYSKLIFKKSPVFNSQSLGFLEDSVLCPVRGAEILKPLHPHYVLLPIEYYKKIQEETGKNLVFCGQIGDDWYSRSLIKAFPGSIFITSQGPYIDFNIKRNAKNIILSVSTFVWLSAWLSDADRIWMPLYGFYNPFQDETNLIPPLDDRYIFDLFPVSNSCQKNFIKKEHKRVMRELRRVKYSEISFIDPY